MHDLEALLHAERHAQRQLGGARRSIAVVEDVEYGPQRLPERPLPGGSGERKPVGAPYFHAGNARTLEEGLSTMFLEHHQSAVANIFNPDATQVKQLVAYILSIDEDEPSFAIPAKGNSGGDLCF
jgi:hypothetical protein